MRPPKRRNSPQRGRSTSTVPFRLLWVKQVLTAGIPLVIVLLSLGVLAVARLEMPQDTAMKVFWISLSLGLTAGNRKLALKVLKAVLTALLDSL